MPTVYTWTVNTPAPSGGSSPVGLARAELAARRPLAFTRKLDPVTRDVLFDRSRRSWARGAVLAEKVLRLLCTEKGSAARDLEYGVDWSSVENARTNSAVAAKLAIVAALRRFVDRGELVGLSVQVDSVPRSSGAALLFKVSFSDPRGERFALLGRPST